jgi:hypothetical protein
LRREVKNVIDKILKGDAQQLPPSCNYLSLKI